MAKILSLISVLWDPSLIEIGENKIFQIYFMDDGARCSLFMYLSMTSNIDFLKIVNNLI